MIDGNPTIVQAPGETEALTRARAMVEGLLPDENVRRAALSLLADLVLTANQVNTKGWEITLYANYIRLNVGMLPPMSLYTNGVSFLADMAEVGKPALNKLQGFAKLVTKKGNRHVPNASWVDTDYEHLDEASNLILTGVRSAIATLSTSQKRTTFYGAHSKALVEYLREFLRQDLPQPGYIPHPPDGNGTEESDLLPRLQRALDAQRLRYTPWQIATYYTALQTKGFVILSGISGTGKTKLAQAMANLLCPADGAEQPHQANCLFISVRPDWRDGKPLLGYFNPLTQTYNETDFLRFLRRAADDYASQDRRPWFVILDEMNLARVEYYLADLLSVLESGRDADGWTRVALHVEQAGQGPLRLPPNLYIVGTVNIDETTHAFSAKVLDRAFTMELTEADFADYPGASTGNAADDEALRQELLANFGQDRDFATIDKGKIVEYIAEHTRVRARLQTLNTLLRPHDLHFGFRVFDEIVAFLAAAGRNGLYDTLGGEDTAFDAAVLMKVLPKFHGSRGKLEKPLLDVLSWCANPDESTTTIGERAGKLSDSDDLRAGFVKTNYVCGTTAERVVRMLCALRDTGFAAFA